MRDLLSLQERHRRLHTAFSQNQDSALRSSTYRSELKQLIRDICRLSQDADSIQDYLWLREMIDEWRTASGVLGIDIDAVLTPPPVAQLRRPTPTDQIVWSDGNLEEWLRRKAHTVSRVRALEWQAQLPAEKVFQIYIERNPEDAHRSGEDWAEAELYLAADVIDGKMDLASSIGPDSYWRIEGLDGRRWARAVKQLKAYLRWRDRGGGWGLDPKTDDYLTACYEIRAAVTDRGRKAPQSAFEPIQRYIEREFLNGDRKLDVGKNKTQRWLRAKAEVVQSAHARTVAEKFMRSFYENISSAVLGADGNATTRVVEGLGLCRGFEYNEEMVNCFEIAVAICYLDAMLAANAMNS